MKKKNILIVDDHLNSLLIARMALERTGRYRVFTAKNFEEGLMRAEEHSIDIAVSDILVGDSRTIELERIEQFLRKLQSRGTQVILASGLQLEERQIKALGVPVLTKPVLGIKLDEIIRNLPKTKPQERISLRALEGRLTHVTAGGREETIRLIRNATPTERTLYALGQKPLTRGIASQGLWQGMQPGTQEHSGRTLDRLMRTREALLVRKPAIRSPKKLRPRKSKPR